MPESPSSIGDLPTPAVLVDMTRVERNARKYKAVVETANRKRFATTQGLVKTPERKSVRLLPHSKTPHGLLPVLEIQKQNGAAGFLASKAREGEILWEHGFREDIFFALAAANHLELQRIQNLTRKALEHGGAVSLLVSSHDGIDNVKQVFQDGPHPNMYVAIDTGGGREGRHWQSRDALETVQHAQEKFGDAFRGVNAYNGRAYGKPPDRLREFMREERDRISEFVKRCEKAGITIDEVGFGSTPTVAVYEDVQGSKVTQLHPGIYIFMDDITRSLGIAAPEDCALTVLATVSEKKEVVIPHKKRKPAMKVGQILLGPGGSKLISSDVGPHQEGGMTVYGSVYKDLSATELFPQARIVKVSEEIPWVRVPLEALSDPLWNIGNTVRLLVRHACPVIAAATDGVWLVDGEKILEPKRVQPLAQGYDQYETQGI